MKRITSFCFILCFSVNLSGQQQSIYSQYIFNLFQINPAYAGARDALSANVSYRAQWVGFDGAPTTQNFSIHSPVHRNMALGLLLQNDEIGARKAPSLSLAYSYQLQLGDLQKLSFGLQGGFVNYQINGEKLEYQVGGDPAAINTNANRWLPVFDFGVMYLSPKGYAGLSASSLNQPKLDFGSFSDARLNTFINFIGGRVFPLNENLALKPGGLVRYNMDGPTQFDANLGLLIKNSLWITTTYRYRFGLVFSAHCMIRKRFHIGYAYDYALNDLVAIQSGTHEVFLGYDFNIRQSKRISPRYF